MNAPIGDPISLKHAERATAYDVVVPTHPRNEIVHRVKTVGTGAKRQLAIQFADLSVVAFVPRDDDPHYESTVRLAGGRTLDLAGNPAYLVVRRVERCGRRSFSILTWYDGAVERSVNGDFTEPELIQMATSMLPATMAEGR